MWDSWGKIVRLFLSRRSGASQDGFVHTDGDTLCVGQHHVAFWHQSTIYMVRREAPDSCVRAIQGMVQMSQGYDIVSMEECNGQ